MATLRERLSKIETKLQTLIEGSAAKLFPGRKSTADMAYQLVDAMHSGLKQDFQGVLGFLITIRFSFTLKRQISMFQTLH